MVGFAHTRKLNSDKFIIKMAVLIILLSLFFIILLINPVDIDTYRCGFNELTGYECPTCGISRSIHSLVRLDIASAIDFNPFGPVIFFFLLIVSVKYSLELILSKEIIIKVKARFLNLLIFSLLVAWFFYWIGKNFL